MPNRTEPSGRKAASASILSHDHAALRLGGKASSAVHCIGHETSVTRPVSRAGQRDTPSLGPGSHGVVTMSKVGKRRCEVSASDPIWLTALGILLMLACAIWGGGS